MRSETTLAASGRSAGRPPRRAGAPGGAPSSRRSAVTCGGRALPSPRADRGGSPSRRPQVQPRPRPARSESARACEVVEGAAGPREPGGGCLVPSAAEGRAPGLGRLRGGPGPPAASLRADWRRPGAAAHRAAAISRPAPGRRSAAPACRGVVPCGDRDTCGSRETPRDGCCCPLRWLLLPPGMAAAARVSSPACPREAGGARRSRRGCASPCSLELLPACERLPACPPACAPSAQAARSAPASPPICARLPARLPARPPLPSVRAHRMMCGCLPARLPYGNIRISNKFVDYRTQPLCPGLTA